MFYIYWGNFYPWRHSPGEGWAVITNWVDHVSDGSTSGSLETFTQSFLHRAWPKTRGPGRGSWSALIVVAHAFSWPPVRLRNVRGGLGRRGSVSNLERSYLPRKEHKRNNVVVGVLCLSLVSSLWMHELLGMRGVSESVLYGMWDDVWHGFSRFLSCNAICH